jgi:hypothetical protein
LQVNRIKNRVRYGAIYWSGGGCKGKIASSSKIQVHVSSAGTEGKNKKGNKKERNLKESYKK